MCKPLISVIIPIYNGETYLAEAINSVLAQPCKMIEVLCINDGSTDDSDKILENFLNNDSRVKVFTQNNQGVAAARNRGICEAEGKYIAFLDQDDIWVPDIVDETIISKIFDDEYDIISFAYFLSNQKVSRLKLIHRGGEKAIDNASMHIGENYRHHSSYFYHRKMVRDNNILVDDFIRNEDEIFRMRCLFSSQKMLYIEKPLFVYRNNSNSVTHGGEIRETIAMCLQGYENLLEKTENNRIKQWAKEMIVHLILELLISTCYGWGNKRNDLLLLEKKYHLIEYWDDVWKSPQDVKQWKVYFEHRKYFILYWKVKNKIITILRKMLRIRALKILYEIKKYPVKRSKEIFYGKSKNIIFDS